MLQFKQAFRDEVHGQAAMVILVRLTVALKAGYILHRLLIYIDLRRDLAAQGSPGRE